MHLSSPVLVYYIVCYLRLLYVITHKWSIDIAITGPNLAWKNSNVISDIIILLTFYWQSIPHGGIEVLALLGCKSMAYKYKFYAISIFLLRQKACKLVIARVTGMFFYVSKNILCQQNWLFWPLRRPFFRGGTPGREACILKNQRFFLPSPRAIKIQYTSQKLSYCDVLHCII